MSINTTEQMKDILFGNMIDTKEIKGQIHFREGKTYLNLTLNKSSKEYEVKSTFENNVFTIDGTIDLLDFKVSKLISC